MPILTTCPGAAHVLPHTDVRHGLAADKLFFTLVTGPDAANLIPNTDVLQGLAAEKTVSRMNNWSCEANVLPHTLVYASYIYTWVGVAIFWENDFPTG